MMQRVFRLDVVVVLVVASLSVFAHDVRAINGTTDLKVDLFLTPLGGGSFQYDITIFNHGLEDLSIVSIVDAPTGDSLIDLTLTTPASFLGSYDPGLGIIDFIEDTEPFGVGTTISGFSFQSSATPPSNFTMFEALTIDGNFIAGSINIIPEPESIALVGLGLTLLAFGQRRRL